PLSRALYAKRIKMKEPWKKDTNDKYNDVLKSVVNLATASLLLPVFFARTFLNVSSEIPLSDIFTCSIYLAWFSASLSIFFGLFFQYCSAKWLRKAYGKVAGLLWCKDSKEKTIERVMEFSFWFCISFFSIGLSLTTWFFLTYQARV
ncbi:hypothetical protein, partial [Vibrio alginolyticus]